MMNCISRNISVSTWTFSKENSLSHTTITNKQKIKTTTTTSTTRSNCMVRVYKGINNIKFSKKKVEYVRGC